jgi:type IV secretion system protein VirD4
MPRRRISPLFAVFVAFVVLMASNAWLKSIFGYGEIATDIPFLLAGAILFLAWRFNRRTANQRNDLLGSARFGDRADVRKLEANGDLLIGRSAKSGKLLHYDSAVHLLTMAPTRSGKGVGTIIPNLLLLDRSVICIDPKGENARVTARAAPRARSVPRSVRRVGSAPCPLQSARPPRPRQPRSCGRCQHPRRR